MQTGHRTKLSFADVWKLRDAKARFNEVVRRAGTEGPQYVTVKGKDAVVVLSAEDYARITPDAAEDYARKRPQAQSKADCRTGADLIAAMQKGRRLGLKLKPMRSYLTARPPKDSE